MIIRTCFPIPFIVGVLTIELKFPKIPSKNVRTTFLGGPCPSFS